MGKAGMWVDTDTRSYMIAMDMVSKTALPEAVAETLNRTADAVTKQQTRNVKKMTIRTPYTLRSMESGGARPFKALNKARGKNMNRMYSRSGTYSKYLWLQEENRTIRSASGGPIPIPTLQARISKSEKKSIRKVYRLAKSDSLRDGAFGQSGYYRFFVGPPRGGGRPRGLYERSRNSKRLTMLRNLENESVRIKGTGFHETAVRKYGTVQFIRAQFKQIAVRRLRGYR